VINETHYARSGDVSIAYQVLGDGPADLILIPGIVSHVEFMHELPGYTRFIASLANFSRVITFDKRGNGLSDPVHEPPSLEERMDDVRAVLDAVGSKKAALLGVSEGAPLAALFSATYPRRTRALILFGGFARMLNGAGFSAGLDPATYANVVEGTVNGWGTGGPLLTIFGLSPNDDPDLRARAARCERLSTTPTMLRRLWVMNSSIDVCDVLTRIRAPSLILHRKDDGVVPVQAGHYLADQIPGARMIELDGQAHFPFVGDTTRTVEEIGKLMGTARPRPGDPPPSAPETPEPQETARASPLALQRTMERGLERLLDHEDELRPFEVGRFTIERLLGRGAMGSIYLAVDQDLNRRVAIKVLRATHVDALRRFRQEALAVARLSHPNVVPIYEFGLDAAVPYLVMEYVPGGTLADLLDEPLPWERSARIIGGVARGLGAAHALGIVHRDVKPANLLLVDPDGDVAKVADFGIAKLSGSVEAMTSQGTVLGTVGYLSPEQARGEVVDARSDVYSLGVTWFRLLTRRRPFEGTPEEVLAQPDRRVPDPRRVRRAIPPAIAELVQRFGALRPEDRPTDGHRAADAIDAATANARKD